MIETIWKVLGLCFSIVSFLPLFDSKHWFFRVFDFLKIQLIAILFLLLLVAVFVLKIDSTSETIIVLIIVASIISHLSIILPYLPLKKNKARQLKNKIIAISVNVKQENKQYDRLIGMVKRIQPDILLTIETNKDWEDNLKEIEGYYKTIIRVPKDNRYGLHLYSKLEVKKYNVHYLISEEYPSIEATMSIQNYEFIFWGIHPPPPSPTEKPTSKQKEAELMKLARMLNKSDKPAIIAGDFNNVTWSRTSKLFSKISKLKDARNNRGLFPTFPAHFRILGFPIDLIFHSHESIQIGSLKTIESIGSDHLPLLFSFSVIGHAKQSGGIDTKINALINRTIKEGKEAARIEN